MTYDQWVDALRRAAIALEGVGLVEEQQAVERAEEFLESNEDDIREALLGLLGRPR